MTTSQRPTDDRRLRTLRLLVDTACSRAGEVIAQAPPDLRRSLTAVQLGNDDCLTSCLDIGLADVLGETREIGWATGHNRSPSTWFAARQCGLARAGQIAAAAELDAPFRVLVAMNPDQVRDLVASLGLVVCAAVAAHARDLEPLRALGRRAGHRALDAKPAWENLSRHQGLLDAWHRALPVRSTARHGDSFARAIGIALLHAQFATMTDEQRDRFRKAARWDTASALHPEFEWPACGPNAFADAFRAATECAGGTHED